MLICVCGPDACGKATLTANLTKAMNEAGRYGHVSSMSFPNYETDTGKLLTQLLRGDLKLWSCLPSEHAFVVPLADKEPQLIIQSLMTVNRYEMAHKIKSLAYRGALVLDRYWYSGLAYGSAAGLDWDWLVAIHKLMQEPTVAIFLKMPIEESFKRRPERRDLYEKDRPFLEKVSVQYGKAAEWLRANAIHCKVYEIDATQPPGHVLAEALHAVEEAW